MIKTLAIIITSLIVLFILNINIYKLYFIKVKKMNYQKSNIKRLKKKSIMKRIFIDAPRQIALDKINKSPDFFNHSGVVVFCGRQGSGKTSALVRYTLDLQEQYEKVKVLSNLDYKYKNEALTD